MKEQHIFAEIVEPEALRQFEEAMSQDFVIKGALMPDCHSGYTLPIGAVVACKDVIVPAYVGYDQGCGMCALPTTFSKEEIKAKSKEIFEGIYKVVPTGFARNHKDSSWEYDKMLPVTSTLTTYFNSGGLRQLGTLGSGNHFIEIGYDEQDRVWIIVHSGSRGVGHDIAEHHMAVASGDGKPREGHFALHVDSPEGQDYINDLNFMLLFALENRRQIVSRVVHQLQYHTKGYAEWEYLINRNHNHAELKDGLWIHRKGATHAEKGMYGVIPGNMRDGSFIVKGKGNPKSLYSSSHGAGRVMGRNAARKTLDLNNFEKSMGGITAKVCKETLDESPFAYKSIFEVMNQQKDLVEVVHHIKPLINIKA